MPQYLLVSRIQINAWILTMHSSSWTDQGPEAGVSPSLQMSQAVVVCIMCGMMCTAGYLLHCARQICIVSCQVRCAAVGYCQMSGEIACASREGKAAYPYDEAHPYSICLPEQHSPAC